MKNCEKSNNLALQQLKATWSFSFFFVNKPKKFNLKHKRKLQGQLFCHAIFENVQHKLSNISYGSGLKKIVQHLNLKIFNIDLRNN